MDRILIFSPWFGPKPATYDAWWLSVKHNPDVDFYVHHDFDWDYPELSNLKHEKMSLEEFWIRLQSQIGVESKNLPPYALCNYKPAYGEAFTNLTEGYDFWGVCDCDLFFGQIRDFLSDSLLKAHDWVYLRAPFMLMRNEPTFNRLYRDVPAGLKFEDVKYERTALAFAEWKGVVPKIKAANVNYFHREDGIELDQRKYWQTPLNQQEFRHQCFYWENGRAYRTYSRGKSAKSRGTDVHREQHLYVHMQKRKMQNRLDRAALESSQPFWLNQEVIEPISEQTWTPDLIDRLNPYRPTMSDPYWQKTRVKAVRRRLKI